MSNHIAAFCFKDVHSLQSAFLRPHIFYEQSELKGQLRGVNFPSSSYQEWLNSVDVNLLTVEEFSMIQILSSPTNQNLEIIGHEHENDIVVVELSIPKDIAYILAYIKGDISTYNHEYAHAVYHINHSYASFCKETYDILDPSIRS